MNKSDCSNDREKLYWDKCGTSFVYIKAELFDNEEHPGAVAAAAMVRYYHKRNLKILAGFSIEGSTLERDDNVLKRSVGRRVALTLRPCNKSAVSGVLEDQKDEEIKKFMSNNSKVRTVEVDSLLVDDMQKTEKSELEYFEELKTAITDLKKTLTAGGYDTAPSQLTGGSALQVEHREKRKVGLPRDVKEKLKRAVSSWDKKRPLRDVIKAVMPEVSEEYVDHFTELAQDLTLKKGIKPPTRVDPHHSWNMNMNDEQRRLISGLYVDTQSDESQTSKYLKNDAGQVVSIKHPNIEEIDHDGAMASSAYYRMASDFFGLKDHVPVTNHFNHVSVNKNAKPIQAEEVIEGAHTPYQSEWASTLKTAKEDGSAHKLAVMDIILDGDTDRHYGNMIGKSGKIINIDNDSSMRYSSPAIQYPSHFDDFHGSEGNVEDGIGKDLMHIDAIKWLSSLRPDDLARYFMNSGVDKSKTINAVGRLQMLQNQASGKTLYQLHDMFNPKKGNELK